MLSHLPDTSLGTKFVSVDVGMKTSGPDHFPALPRFPAFLHDFFLRFWLTCTRLRHRRPVDPYVAARNFKESGICGIKEYREYYALRLFFHSVARLHLSCTTCARRSSRLEISPERRRFMTRRNVLSWTRVGSG